MQHTCLSATGDIRGMRLGKKTPSDWHCLAAVADNVQGRVVADFVDGQAKVAQSSRVPPSSLQAHVPACVHACVRLRRGRVRVCVYVCVHSPKLFEQKKVKHRISV